jgi:hypothetical protein
MYLAPLNYDRFFERIFKDPTTSKAFLEDVLNKSITELEILPRKNKITDEAALVEFDFRCKIDGELTTIDMQQWYKSDVVKRFFLYFCNNTSLQLETMKSISIPLSDGKEYKTKDYTGLESAITLIWMADDTMGFREDMVAYSMFPEMMNDFIRNNDLWENPNMEILLKHRTELLKLMDNKSKNLDFLSTNRLVFMLQPNIVKNKNNIRSFKWFEFAQKTKNRNNVATDFKKYSNDPIISTIMEKLRTNVLPTDDFQYITDFEAHAIGVKNYHDMLIREARKEAQKEMAYVYKDIVERAEQEAKHAEQQAKYAEQQAKHAEQQAKHAEQQAKHAEQQAKHAEQQAKHAEQEKQVLLTRQLHLIDKCLKRGDSLESIESFLEIDRGTLNDYLEQLKSLK